jgi:serine protease AprX
MLRLFMKRIGSSILILILATVTGKGLLAQNTNAYFIQFSDKVSESNIRATLSEKALERRTKFNLSIDSYDMPVSANYISVILQDTTIRLRYALKWHNAIVVNCTKTSLHYLTDLPFVRAVKFVGETQTLKSSEGPLFYAPRLVLKDATMKENGYTKEDYGVSYAQNKQIGIPYLHRLGYTGKGIDVAVFDAGFKNLNAIPGFLKHQANDRLTFCYDVAQLDNLLTDADNHGTAVTSCLGAYQLGHYVGSAPLANLFLFRTEYGATESPLEELNWCKAAELSDSAGVDMITSSLGYFRFDDTTLSYRHSDLDGFTSYISLGARIAVEKGILVLNSAGNEGDNLWRKIGTPADVATVLTIGAAGIDNQVGRFSSQGYNAKGDIKPDVVACGVLTYVGSPNGNYYQGYGTSYATPVAAGGVACLLQAFPGLTPLQINQLIRSTASQSQNPDSIMGYGVAQFDAAYNLQQLKTAKHVVSGIVKIDPNGLIIFKVPKDVVHFDVYSVVKFLGVLPYKKHLSKGTLKGEQEVFPIPFNQRAICNQKYTIRLSTKSTLVMREISNDCLILCED